LHPHIAFYPLKITPYAPCTKARCYFCAIGRNPHYWVIFIDFPIIGDYTCIKTGNNKETTRGDGMGNTHEKIKSAIDIFKSKLPDVKGKFRAFVSESNSNEVDIFSETGLYCTVNVRSGMLRGV